MIFQLKDNETNSLSPSTCRNDVPAELSMNNIGMQGLMHANSFVSLRNIFVYMYFKHGDCDETEYRTELTSAHASHGQVLLHVQVVFCNQGYTLLCGP